MALSDLGLSEGRVTLGALTVDRTSSSVARTKLGWAAAVAVAALTGGAVWAYAKTKANDNHKGEDSESEKAESGNSPSQTAAEVDETKDKLNLSWCDLVEEEEQLQLQGEKQPICSEVDTMNRHGFDEHRLSSKLEQLNLEKNSSQKTETNTQDGGSETKTEHNSKVLMASPSKSLSGGAVSDSGVVSPTCDDPKSSSPAPTQSSTSSSHSNPDCGFDSAASSTAANIAEEEIVECQTALSDSGKGSEADDHVKMVYTFSVPGSLCGKLIGSGGQNVKQLKAMSHCSVNLYDEGHKGGHYRRRNYQDNSNELQSCVLEGTRAAIDKCLQLIRSRFPIDQYPDLSLEQTNPMTTALDQGYFGEASISPQTGFSQGGLHDVVVSAIVSPAHVFIQQPNHPTFQAFGRLKECMQHIYGENATPEVPRPVQVGLICVVPGEDEVTGKQQWHRVQVVNYDSVSDSCDVKFLDYGGYDSVSTTDLRQIRSDFLTLPYQAIECYLSNVAPVNGMQWDVQSAVVLEELVTSGSCQGQMLCYSPDYIPLIQLYSSSSANDSVLINRELVERGAAAWVEYAGETTQVQQ